MPPIKPKLNFHCKQLFLKHSITNVIEREQNTSEVLKFLTLSSTTLQASRLNRIYTLGIIVRKEVDSLELFFSDRTDFDQFYLEERFHGTFDETQALITLLRPTQVVLELYDDENDNLRRVVGFFDEMECRISMKMERFGVERGSLLNVLSSKLTKLECLIFYLIGPDILPLNLEHLVVPRITKSQLSTLLCCHKVKSLRTHVDWDFNDNADDAKEPINIGSLKVLDVGCFFIYNVRPLVQFLVGNGAHLAMLKIGSRFAFSDLTDYDELVQKTTNSYQEFLDLKEQCHGTVQQLCIDFTLSLHSNDNLMVCFGSYKPDDNWVDDFKTLELAQAFEYKLIRGWHRFEAKLNIDFMELNFLITVQKRCF